ncbi:adenylyltransferase/cytidyltransferase family protein [Candidatus Pacearchaeota archaeon]|nr:adenylyltransferase/cytidyltransferase family protein [Candidatus Pacearchaeota archaeon]
MIKHKPSIPNEKYILFANGGFDCLHAGHFDFLLYCLHLKKQFNACLVVAIDSDEKIKEKGKDRPIFSEQERRECLLKLNFGKESIIDSCPIFDTNEDLDELIKQCKPNILIKGESWKGNVVGEKYVKTIFFYSENKINISTTKIIERIADKLLSEMF